MADKWYGGKEAVIGFYKKEWGRVYLSTFCLVVGVICIAISDVFMGVWTEGQPQRAIFIPKRNSTEIAGQR
jgi:hypothetical protein